MNPRFRLRILFPMSVCLTLGLTPLACDDDDPGEPTDIITGDITDAGDTTQPDTTQPDTVDPDTVDPDTADTADTADMASCGDGVVDGGEVCDGATLAGETCESQGFGGGTLACNATCDGYDTSGCDALTTCGDDTLDTGEVCDGTALGGATCESEGFDGGTLGCATDCSGLDTSGCTRVTCGNGQLDAGEDCDGTELNSQTCAALSFDGGTLACADNCTFDTTACFTCGNDTLETGEACDGTDLGGATCAGEGFDGGTLTCAADCSALDTSTCTTCGNATLEAGEVCDTTELGGATCESEGFDGGTLACATTCDAFDTTSCTTITCGNSQLDAGEDCDGTELNNQTCSDLGFAMGTLACTNNCTFDTSACTSCGNNILDTGEACDGTELDGQTCESLGYDSGTLVCDASCGFDESGCVRAAYPAAGEVIITEIMQNPSTLFDSEGEWFEVFNTGATTLSLNGCRFEGAATNESFTVLGAPTVAAGAFLTFAVESASGPGFTPDATWTSFSLGNGSDLVRLVCPDAAGVDATIDEVAWDGGATFPDPSGRSMQLDPASFDATANDDGANWCPGMSDYNGDFGTPGAVNDDCPVPQTIDFCRLQFPLTITGEEGTTETVYGRLYIAGLTDQTTGNDTHPLVHAALGYGPDGTDPAIDTTWTWQPAVPNPSYTAVGNDEDEYQSDLTLPLAANSPYDYAYRFSGDGGTTWTYCDTGAGSSDGYDPANAGQMITTMSTAVFDVFFSEYVEGSSNNKALEIYNAGAAAVDLSQCEVRVYANGAVTPGNTQTLTGTSVAAGDVWVVCNSSIDTTLLPTPSPCDETGSATFYNGDDAVELVCNGITRDVIGQIGLDPGSEWGTGDTSTADNTLRRKCSVTTGDIIGSDAFDPATEWDGYAQDEMSGLGAHSVVCP